MKKMTSCKSLGRELRLFRWYSCSAVASGFVMCAIFSKDLEKRCSEESRSDSHCPRRDKMGTLPIDRVADLKLREFEQTIICSQQISQSAVTAGAEGGERERD